MSGGMVTSSRVIIMMQTLAVRQTSIQYLRSLLELKSLRRYQSLLLQISRDDYHRLLRAELVASDPDLGVLGLLVRRTNAGEVLDLTGAGLLIEALGVALFRDFDGDLDVDLDEGKGLVVALRCRGVQVASNLAVGFVW